MPAPGIKDILVSNQVRDPAKIDRLARLPKLGARTLCCVDDIENVADLSAAAKKHGTEIEVLVEIDCGAGRCGVTTSDAVVEIAKAVDAVPGLKFSGIQACQGAMQHMDLYQDRKAKIDIAVAMIANALAALKAEGLTSDIVGGGGAPAPIISKAIPGSITSCNAAPMPSWMQITGVFWTRTASRFLKPGLPLPCSF